MNQIIIAQKKIARHSPPFTIAEVGINHNGDLSLALEMIRVAKEAGADAVKFQTFRAEEFVGDPHQTYTYTSQGKQVTESMLAMFKRYEFCHDDWLTIKKTCDEVEIIFLSTPQNKTDLDLLLDLGIPAIKVGSDDFTNLPLLQSYAETKLPMIVSCGMADLSEVYQALHAIGTLDGYPTVLMLCTSQYPTPPEDVNLLKLRTLAHAFPMAVPGFSDHTQGPLASALAVAFGASVFEKHFTLDHGLPGPDHWFSENPQGLREWVLAIGNSFKMMGSGIVRPTLRELSNKREFQRVIIAARDINSGEQFSINNLTMKRVTGGKGLPPKMLNFLLGKSANKGYKKNEPVLL
jgi:N,N'-diacetyllegionaminate synthase